MRSDDSIFVGIDIGTVKVCALVGQLTNDRRIRVLGVGTVPSDGIRKGGVVNLEAVTNSVEAAKDKAERTSGFEISSALINISGAHITSLNSKGMAGVSGRTVGTDDIRRALEAARSVAIPYNQEIIHVVPRGYIVDGQDGIKTAIGMHGYRLEVEAHMVTAGATALKNLEKCVQDAGIEVDGWVLSSIAAAEVVLTETEREMGVVVCDVGGGTTDIAIYIEGAVWHTAVIPVGGEHLTNDISQGLHLPQDTAEMVKQRHGHAVQAAMDQEQSFVVKPFGSDRSEHISRADLARIIEPRIEELFGLVRQEIMRSGYDGLLPAGMVMTGGTSQLPGIRQTAGNVLRLPVRIAKPDNVRGLVDQLQTPAFSTSIGLLHWAWLMEQESGIESYSNGSTWPRFDLRSAADFLKRLLPD
jgi:cell division protein FtsA